VSEEPRTPGPDAGRPAPDRRQSAEPPHGVPQGPIPSIGNVRHFPGPARARRAPGCRSRSRGRRPPAPGCRGRGSPGPTRYLVIRPRRPAHGQRPGAGSRLGIRALPPRAADPATGTPDCFRSCVFTGVWIAARGVRGAVISPSARKLEDTRGRRRAVRAGQDRHTLSVLRARTPMRERPRRIRNVANAAHSAKAPGAVDHDVGDDSAHRWLDGPGFSNEECATATRRSAGRRSLAGVRRAPRHGVRVEVNPV
jgi:hypothetical protein